MVLKNAVSYHTPRQTMQAGKISLNMTTNYYIEKILHFKKSKKNLSFQNISWMLVDAVSKTGDLLMFNKVLKENQLLGGDWEPKIPGGEGRLLCEDKTRRLHFQTSARCLLGPSDRLRGSANPEREQWDRSVCILPECPNSGWRVKDDLCSIQAIHEPVQRVVAPIADVHSNCPKLCLKYWVSCVSFHVVSRLQTNKRKKQQTKNPTDQQNPQRQSS